jgi:hypothetical protein
MIIRVFILYLKLLIIQEINFNYSALEVETFQDMLRLYHH